VKPFFSASYNDPPLSSTLKSAAVVLETITYVYRHLKKQKLPCSNPPVVFESIIPKPSI
jgi:hypothetical protein